jgi:hypothetical protein
MARSAEDEAPRGSRFAGARGAQLVKLSQRGFAARTRRTACTEMGEIHPCV